MIDDVIYVIQKEYLRTINGTDRNYRIWCASESIYGYTLDYTKAVNELERLNDENKNNEIRYVITEVEPII